MVFHSRISFGRTLEFFQRRPNEHARKTTAERRQVKQEAKRGISNNHNNNNTESKRERKRERERQGKTWAKML